MAHSANRLNILVVLGRVSKVMIVFMPAIGSKMIAVGAMQVIRVRPPSVFNFNVDALAGLDLVAIPRRLRGRAGVTSKLVDSWHSRLSFNWLRAQLVR